MENMSERLNDLIESLDIFVLDMEYATNGTLEVGLGDEYTLFDPLPQLTYGEVPEALPYIIDRFIMIGPGPTFYSREVPIEEFNQVLVDVLEDDLSGSTSFVPDQNSMGEIIEKAHIAGFSVYAYRQDTSPIGQWAVTNKYKLKQLTEEMNTPFEPFVNPVDSFKEVRDSRGDQPSFIYLADDNGTYVLVKDSFRVKVKPNDVFFNIVTRDGQLLMEKVFIYQLVPTLYLLMSGFSVKFIRNFLLRFSQEEGYGTNLMDNLVYTLCQTSDKLLLRNADSFSKISRLAMDRYLTTKSSAEYRYYDAETGLASDNIILPREIGLILDQDYEYDDSKERRQLSDLLISIAEERGCFIQRKDCFLTERTEISNIELVDGEMVDYSRHVYKKLKSYKEGSEIQLTRLYDLVSKDTGEYLVREMPKNQFLTYMLILLFDN